jgi:hypothetical protein
VRGMAFVVVVGVSERSCRHRIRTRTICLDKMF